MGIADEHLSELQREALWKWRWLGWRDSTPAFKATVVMLAIAALALAFTAIS